MAFMLNEEERTPYGTPVLKRISKAGTAEELASAVEQLNRSAGGRAFTWIMGRERPVGIMSAVAGPAGLVLNTTQEGEMPPPVPAAQFVNGIMSEAAGNGAAKMMVKFKNDESTYAVSAVRLELLDSDDPVYIITIETGAEVKAQVPRDAEVAAPRNSDDVARCLARLASAARRPNLPKEPLYCHIPSVRNKYVDGQDMANELGTTCVVDIVLKKEKHLELELMSVSPQEAHAMQADPGAQSAENVAKQCASLGAGLPLFFMYKGIPYAASEFSARDGMPATLTLEPWADVAESEDAGEIRMIAAEQVANGLI